MLDRASDILGYNQPKTIFTDEEKGFFKYRDELKNDLFSDNI